MTPPMMPGDMPSVFFDHLFEAFDIVEVRFLPSGQSLWNTAEELRKISFDPKNTQNVFVGINPRKKIGGKDSASVAIFRTLFADFDNMTLLEVLQILKNSGLPWPTMITESGGGYHCYWRLEVPITEPGLWMRYQVGIIQLLGSDPKIKDPARIMRLPGTTNRKPERNNAMCKIIEIHDYVVSIDDFPLADSSVTGAATATATRTEPMSTTTNEGYANLSRATMQFLLTGAPEGERNQRLFSAASDMWGNGIGKKEAEERLLSVCARIGLREDEVRLTIQSAYGKPRSAARPPTMTLEELNARTLDLPPGSVTAEPAATGTGGPVSTPARIVTRSDDPEEYSEPTTTAPCETVVLSNVVDALKNGKKVGEKVPVTYFKSARQIFDEMRRYSDGWPKNCGGQLFAVEPIDRKMGPQEKEIWLSSADIFMAWLQRVMTVRWCAATATCYDRETGSIRTPITKQEFFQSVRAMVDDLYTSIQMFPHYPPLADAYYLKCLLPEPTGEHLDTLVQSFNAATENDLDLLTVLLLTLVWGGEPGMRPAFLIDADQVDSGKTTTAITICEVVGDAFFSQDIKEPWDDMCKRWMSGPSRDSRAIVFDNVKGTIRGTGIESAITSKTISGWVLYQGSVIKPNIVTVICTMNDGSASEDMATRFVPIKMAPPPKERTSWRSWAAKYVRVNQWAIISDAIQMLKQKDQCELTRKDRFSDWMEGVLAKHPRGNLLADHIFTERTVIDGDAEKTEELTSLLIKRFDDCERGWAKDSARAVLGDDGQYVPGRVWVAPVELYAAAVDAGLWTEDKVRKDVQPPTNMIRAFTRFIRGRLGKLGAFPKTTTQKFLNVRVWGLEIGKTKAIQVDVSSIVTEPNTVTTPTNDEDNGFGLMV